MRRKRIPKGAHRHECSAPMCRREWFCWKEPCVRPLGMCDGCTADRLATLAEWMGGNLVVPDGSEKS